MYAAAANATLDELFFKYFQKNVCPLGTAGVNCELPCHPVHGTANAEGLCICESTKWTGNDCSHEVSEEKNLVSPPLKVISYIMLVVNWSMILGCGVWLFRNRSTQQVRAIQGNLLSLVLLGCGISSSTIIALAQEYDVDGPASACMVIPWLYSMGFCITYGGLIANMHRIYGIFNNNSTVLRTVSSSTSAGNNFNETLGVVSLIVLVDVLILIWWSIMSPLEWKHQTDSGRPWSLLDIVQVITGRYLPESWQPFICCYLSLAAICVTVRLCCCTFFPCRIE